MTRRGNPVRIICTDRKHGEDDLPIVFLEEFSNGGEFLLTCKSNGRDGSSKDYDTQYDLFFADEEKELTELQKTLEEDCDYYIKLYNDGNTREELREWIKCWCHRIIELARKEIEKENPYSGNQNQEWSKEEEERLITDYLKFKGYEDDSIWLKSFKGRVKPKQEWSEKDEHCIELLLPIIDSSSLIPKNRKKCKEFLKSLKDRVQPQPEQKWNKEDEFMLTRCIGILGKCYMGELPTKVEEELVWLISVKELIRN